MDITPKNAIDKGVKDRSSWSVASALGVIIASEHLMYGIYPFCDFGKITRYSIVRRSGGGMRRHLQLEMRCEDEGWTMYIWASAPLMGKPIRQTESRTFGAPV